MDVLRAAQKGDPHPGSDRLRFHRKFSTLALQLGYDIVDPVDAQPDVLEPEIGWFWRVGDGLPRGHPRDEYGYSTEIEVEARLAVRVHRANDLGPEHLFVPACGCLNIGAAQMDMVIGEGRHGYSF